MLSFNESRILEITRLLFDICMMCGYGSRGGGALRFEQVPTAKRPRGAKVVNAKIQGLSTPFGAKKGGGQLQTKNTLGALAYSLCLYSLYFIRYMAFFI